MKKKPKKPTKAPPKKPTKPTRYEFRSFTPEQSPDIEGHWSRDFLVGHWTREHPKTVGLWVYHPDSHPPECIHEVVYISEEDIENGTTHRWQCWWWSIPLPELPPLPNLRELERKDEA